MAVEEKFELEKKCYAIAESLKEFLPIDNDRSRLGYCLVKHFNGEGDPADVIVSTNKFVISGITPKELANKIAEKIK